MDIRHLALIRDNVSAFLRRCGELYDGECLLLDIAPQNHEGASPYFKASVVRTLDIDPASNAYYIADICADNSAVIPDGCFDRIVCTEVLEHTLDPFAAVGEIYRMLKPGGLVFITTPFNFRIHGPLPDCWRFTEHGLRVLLKRFEIIELKTIETEGRDLMPVHYTVVVRRPQAQRQT